MTAARRARLPHNSPLTSVRELAPSELGRIAEIDRSERIEQQYKAVEGRLELVDVDIDAPRWGAPGENPVEHYVDKWQPALRRGGRWLGAFAGDSLAGFAVFDPVVTGRPGAGNLAALHVSRPYRGSGIGRSLVEEIITLARECGTERLYVSATPTRDTVDFYMRLGFEPIAEPDPEMLAREPDDIHLELSL